MKIKLKELKKALAGEIDFGLDTQQAVLDRVFGIGEETAEVPDYDERTGESVGIREMTVRRTVVAESRGDFNEIGSESVGRELMGRDFYHQVDAALADPGFFPRIKSLMRRKKRIGESVQADTASLYEPINTWGSFVLGLYDHKVLAGYDSAPRVFERLIPTIPTAIHGAQKHTLHDYDGTLPSYDGLAEMQEEDTARGVPAWVWAQQIKEFGLQYAITMEALKSDLDGGLGKRGEQIGMALAKFENYRAGSTYLGYDNKYCFNTINNSTPSCNTFLSGTASTGGWQSSGPFSYINLFYSMPLLTVDTLSQQYVAMLQLQAPITEWRLDVGEDFFLVVTPTLFARALQIVHSIRDFLAATGGIAPTSGLGRTTESENILRLRNLNIEVVDMGQEWKDVLTGGMNASSGGGTPTISKNGPPATWSDYQGNKANGSNKNPLTQATADVPYSLMDTNGLVPTAANAGSNSADGFWMLVSKKKPYVQRETWIPPQPRVFNLGPTDMARRIGMRGDVIQATRFVTIEPRRAQINLPNASGTQ